MNPDIPTYKMIRFRTYLHDAPPQGNPTPEREVLRSQEELDAYLKAAKAQAPAGKAIRWEHEVAIAVSIGQAPTPGYDVDIVAVIAETGGFVGHQTHVLYVRREPHGVEPDHVVFPQHVVVAANVAGIVSFRELPDLLGHKLKGLFGSNPMPGAPAIKHPPITTLRVGEEGIHPTTEIAGEEGIHTTTLIFGEEGPHTTIPWFEEAGSLPGLEHGPGPGGGGDGGPFT